MIYKIAYTVSAEKELSDLPKPEFKKIKAAIDSLTLNPFPHGSLKLSGGNEKLYRIRKGDYRVIYSVEHNIITITILKIANRKEAYRS